MKTALNIMVRRIACDLAKILIHCIIGEDF
jgi:hypothetical protein